jgi:hypothetical protein
MVFGKPLSKMQVNQFKFVDMMIQIQAAQELSHRCIRQMAANNDATLDISMAKVFCTTMHQYVATTCMQLWGGAGYMYENPAGRAFVDSRLAAIGGGADEVMNTMSPSSASESVFTRCAVWLPVDPKSEAPASTRGNAQADDYLTSSRAGACWRWREICQRHRAR